MLEAAKRAVAPKEHRVVVAVPSATSSLRVAHELERVVGKETVLHATNLARLREAIRASRPQVILLDERLLDTDSLAKSVAEFSAQVSTILVAAYDRQPEVTRLIADGQLEFVPRSGEWAQLAASLVARRLRWAETYKTPGDAIAGNNLGELFRHEINNPLTGILGNAELILAHSDRLPAIDTQRIRTVVELAVRLRETVRRVSNAWEAQSDSAGSA
jgi:signal transduction histidine kinase